MTTPYYVFIDKSTNKVEQQIRCHNFASAERVERGVNINLNCLLYETKISETPSADCEISS